MTTFFYARVSTAEQTLAHQVTQAREAGFTVDDCNIIADHGVSGVNTKLAEREQGKRLFDLLRRGDVLVVRWVDRLGRRYDDVTDTIRRFLNAGVTIKTVISGLTFDGTPANAMEKAVRDAMIGFMAAMGEAQADATALARDAGIEHAKANNPLAYRGRKPAFNRKQLEEIRILAEQGLNDCQIGRTVGTDRLTVGRIKKDFPKAEDMLRRWGL